jgi:hypothetical protein
MRFKPLYFLVLFAGSAFIFSCSETAKLKKLQKNFIPEIISNIYIGMPLKDVKEARGVKNLYVIENDIMTTVKEEYETAKDSISLIQYQFGKDKKLYEVIIEYVTDYNTTKVYKLKYGDPNNGKEWLFTLNKNVKLKIWIYQNRLCIADSKHFKNS